MKRLLLTVFALAALTLLALPQSSYAQPDLECLAMYFPGDPVTNGDLASTCTTATFGSQVTAYIVYVNPTLVSVRGVECGVDLTTPAKDAQVSSFATITYPVDVVDVGINDTVAGTYNLIAGFGTAYPLPTGWDKVLATFTIFYLDPGEVDITLRAADPESPPVNGEVKVVDSDYNTLSLPVGHVSGGPSLVINGTGCGNTLPDEDMSFGSVKSLFR